MAIFDKGSCVFKHHPEDFIVEEVNEDGRISAISDSLSVFGDAKVNFGNLDTADRRDFLMFDLEKINMDHFSAMSALCKGIGKYTHEIGYAGSKDKVAWTCQRISVFDPNIDKIKSFSNPNMILKNFKWGKHKIKIGDLKGNRFRVILRDADKNALKVLSRVRNTGYIPNLFGSQRFGSLRGDNFQIGKLVLKRRYKEAVFAYVTGYGHDESKEVKLAKRRLKDERDYVRAKEYFPKELYIENNIIDHLMKNKDDYMGALNLIGEKVLLIMVQSVQSKIFNSILDKAIDSGAISNKDSITIPGYDTESFESKLKEIEEEVFDENDLDIEDFRNEEFPYLTLTSSKRNAFFKVQDIEINIEDDEVFKPGKKINLSFTLDSGSYATTFLEYFFDLR